MNNTERAAGMLIAEGLARTGDHRNWRGVETRMYQLGHLDAESWLSSLRARGEIDALCSEHYRDL